MRELGPTYTAGTVRQRMKFSYTVLSTWMTSISHAADKNR